MAVPVLQTIRYGNEVGAQYLLSLERAAQWQMGGGIDGKPVLRLGNSAVQAVPNDVDTEVLWNTAISDVHGMWSVDTPDVITIKETGHYFVHCSFQYAGNATGSRHLWPLINETDIDGSADRSEVGAGLETLHYFGLLSLPEGTTLQFMTRQDSGAALNSGLGNFNPRLNMFWVGRIAGQIPAYVGNDESELPASVAQALTAIADRLALIEGRLNALEATTPVPPPDPDTVTQVVRINAGGTAFIGADGVAWEADRGSSTGSTSLQGTGNVYGTQFDTLYFSERWGASVTYAIPDLPIGAATVRLHFSENHAATNAAGERVFDVTVNGVLALDNHDIFVAAGNAQYTPVVESIATTIPSTGVCTISMISSVNAATVMGIEIICTGNTAPPDPDTPTPPPAPTGFWRSGVTRPEGSQQYTQISVDQWASWRQRQCTIALTYTARGGGWSDLVGNGYALTNWTDKALTALVGQPFTPNSLGNSPNGDQARAIINGAGDAWWPQWGTNLKNREAAGFTPVVTNLCFEFNGNWMKWSATNASEFISAWRRVVDKVRSTHPTAKFCWTVNAGYSQNPPSHDARNCWPGDDYVDYIGVDIYDHYPRAVGYAAVDTREETNTGRARYWADFAALKNKQMIFPEWGLNNSTDNIANGTGGGDNPGFIEWMFDFFTELQTAGLMFGECYFNDRNTVNVWSDLMEGSRNPQSSLKYRELWLPAQP